MSGSAPSQYRDEAMELTAVVRKGRIRCVYDEILDRLSCIETAIHDVNVSTSSRTNQLRNESGEIVGVHCSVKVKIASAKIGLGYAGGHQNLDERRDVITVGR